MTTQEIIFFIVKVLAGTGVFLVGVSMLTANIEQLATSKIRKIFNKTANKKLVNVGIGTLTTAFIQSSGVTTVNQFGTSNSFNYGCEYWYYYYCSNSSSKCFPNYNIS